MQIKIDYLKKLLLPHTCLLCKSQTTRPQDLCLACLNELPTIPNPCLRCAKSLPGQVPLTCGDCLANSPAFHHTLALFAYQAPLTHLIMQLKFNHMLTHASILGELLAEKISHAHCFLPDIIVPVPLSAPRLKTRGFNQALEIARPISSRFHIPLDTFNCLRIKHTEAQATLSAKKRQLNIKNAFQINMDFSKLNVAVVDDVITTGHTMTEFCKSLKKAGAARIDVWCCARAILCV